MKNDISNKANTIKKMFSRTTEISISISADKSIVWALLTNAGDYNRWNKTIISIKGNIAMGEKIKLTSTLDPKREFKLKILEFVPGSRLVWGDNMGKRIFTLVDHGNETIFTMHEKIGGPLFPLFASMIPSFDESFEQFANHLKQEAEIISKSK